VRNAYEILVGRPEGKTLLGRRRRRRQDNNTTGLREIVLQGSDWIHLGQNIDQRRAIVNTAGNFLTS
jgi:predicted NAD-dependent protein-ADP-ribosyltransferase YbiA (DUF1768 family)